MGAPLLEIGEERIWESDIRLASSEIKKLIIFESYQKEKRQTNICFSFSRKSIFICQKFQLLKLSGYVKVVYVLMINNIGKMINELVRKERMEREKKV